KTAEAIASYEKRLAEMNEDLFKRIWAELDAHKKRELQPTLRAEAAPVNPWEARDTITKTATYTIPEGWVFEAIDFGVRSKAGDSKLSGVGIAENGRSVTVWIAATSLYVGQGKSWVEISPVLKLKRANPEAQARADVAEVLRVLR